jgi:HPt (histidine-containing phosphotransfer) domain-containing protein
MDGFEATRRIVARLGSDRPPIIALTANAMSEDRDACIAAGMDGFLSKPVRRDELAAVLAGISADDRAAAPPSGATPTSTSTPTEPEAVPPLPPDPGPAGPRATADRLVLESRVTAMVGARDEAFERDLIAAFLDGEPDLRADIESGWAERDIHRVMRAAHTMRAQASMFGAAVLVDRCRALESGLADDTIDDDARCELVDGALRQLDDVVGTVRSF